MTETIRIPTQEGTEISFAPASLADRTAALLVDLVILAAILAGAGCCGGGLARVSIDVAGVWVHASLFLALNVYFAAFECGRRGATPGKRLLGIRVIDRNGGVLRPSATFLRGTSRWLEIAAVVIAFHASESASMPWWAELGERCWALPAACVPFVHRHGLRLGDLVAGTAVVRRPVPVLRRDVDQSAEQEAFTSAELDVYGEAELHVLESVLRTPPGAPRDEKLREASRLIARKIGRAAPPDPERWLRAFYAAQRDRLERRLALGRRKKDKLDAG
ncbi:MAG TPA: RDD family protein [Planctomycetota bacterium]|nr:RDD family protein [Planctomycetota bacterium]